jgi:type IV pilus assembly protein PilB
MSQSLLPTAAGEPLDMDQVRIDPAWALKIPAALALRRLVLPFASVSGVVYVACQDLQDRSALEAVERSVRLPICPQIADPASLQRAPQDGRFTYRLGSTGQAVDVRLASLPTKYGERMTVRLLALQTDSLTLERLGMSPTDLACFSQAIEKPHGMILLTGSTGSGKTTTLYAALRRLIGQRELNVVTIEDPIEYDIAGVAQVEVDSADKVTFGKALRSVLRHDPDVVMIGEIRDRETADVAVKSALTGHLVFSTLHTNSAPSAVTRLADMGIERYLIAATIRLAVAQRLVRRLCPRCRQPRELTEAEAVALGNPQAVGATVYEPGGCLYCANRGFVGRIGLFEMMPVDEALSRQVAAGADEGAIVAEIRHRKVPRLIDDALAKICAGTATVREVLAAATIW